MKQKQNWAEQWKRKKYVKSKTEIESDFKMSNKRNLTSKADGLRIGDFSDVTKKRRVSISTDIQNQIERKLHQLSESDYGKRGS